MSLCMVNGASDSRDTGVLPLCGLTLVVDKVLPPIWHEPPLCWWALQRGSATCRSTLKVAHSAGVCGGAGLMQLGSNPLWLQAQERVHVGMYMHYTWVFH